MNTPLYNRPAILLLLAFGGLISFSNHLATLVARLYAVAQTPQGSAAVVVASFLISAVTLIVVLLRAKS